MQITPSSRNFAKRHKTYDTGERLDCELIRPNKKLALQVDEESGGWPSTASCSMILSWNCRGLRNDPTICTLKSFLRASSPSIVFLFETRCSSTVANSVAIELGFD